MRIKSRTRSCIYCLTLGRERNAAVFVVCAQRTNLRRHMIVRHRQALFGCPLCGEGFRTRSTLAEHRLRSDACGLLSERAPTPTDTLTPTYAPTRTYVSTPTPVDTFTYTLPNGAS